MSLTVQMRSEYTNDVITRSMQKLGSNGGTDMNNLTKTMLGGGGDNTLIDYAAIKNGSYGKLLKAYYSEVDDADTKKAIKEEAANKKAELVQDALCLTRVFKKCTAGSGNPAAFLLFFIVACQPSDWFYIIIPLL